MARIAWTTPALPLPAVAVAGRDEVGEALARRCAGRDEVTIHCSDRWTVVVAEPEELPWIDGVVYLGELPGVTRLLVPVHTVPTIPPDVLQAAVRRATGGAGGKAALLPLADAGDIVVLDP